MKLLFNYFDSEEWKNCKMLKKEDVQISPIKPIVKNDICELIQNITKINEVKEEIKNDNRKCKG